MTHPIPFHETPPTGATADLAARIQALIPVLETERLVLRAPRIEDFEAFAAMVDGPRGSFFGHPQTRADAWEIFMQLTGTWPLRGHGAWTITDRASGAVLGMVLIGAEPGDMEPELGWAVTPEAEGRGIAFEAAQAVRDHAFGPLGLTRLVSYVDADNIRSVALAERLGATRDQAAEAALPEADRCAVYRHSAPGGR
ncbi:GNAT family N-acetyltransferase [Roseovarius sp.]|uniref:GNAT family N-acetyltransferase n=1 Tax=Roseovarius sp. TaxID=1486281 RepID=UPI003BAD4FA5